MRYVALLEKWNRTYNLTAIREPAEVVSHHLLDSLAVVPHLPLPAEGALADVGAGAGLPGIPSTAAIAARTPAIVFIRTRYPGGMRARRVVNPPRFTVSVTRSPM